MNLMDLACSMNIFVILSKITLGKETSLPNFAYCMKWYLYENESGSNHLNWIWLVDAGSNFVDANVRWAKKV